MQEFSQETLSKLEKKEKQELYDRLTAVSHIQVEHFSRHQKIEGYYEYADMGHLFTCDRLLKLETMFSRIQMGYNPNRGRSFIFANIKTSRYDTAASRYQREMKEYQMKSLLKGNTANKGFVAKRQSGAAVLIEKAENKPWSEGSVRAYLGRVNLEALQKTMPFFSKEEEKQELVRLREEQRELKEEIAERSRQGEHQENAALRAQAMEQLYKENILEALLYRKEAGSRYFLRKLNYAFDFQKHEMFQYYKDRRDEAEQAAEAESLPQEPEDEDENL